MRNPFLSVSLWLLQHLLPNKIKDDISGDLEEEYTKYILPEQGVLKSNVWLFKQTFLTCSRYVFTYSRGFAFLAATLCLTIFLTLAFAIVWLSNQYDPSTFSELFWQNWLSGHSHQIFFEPAFWQYLPEAYKYIFDINLWFDWIACLYTFLALYFLAKIDKSKQLSVMKYIFLALIFMVLPYLWGTYQFMFNDIVIKKSGPIVAIMWLTILYMILPIGYQIVRKLGSQKSTDPTV
ncbi:MAG: hypothetical protein HRT38_20865 [Alteromonadaceae bacterium]|nr:hypothetical protein [Alteromonadaceae bacterium]